MRDDWHGRTTRDTGMTGSWNVFLNVLEKRHMSGQRKQAFGPRQTSDLPWLGRPWQAWPLASYRETMELDRQEEKAAGGRRRPLSISMPRHNVIGIWAGSVGRFRALHARLRSRLANIQSWTASFPFRDWASSSFSRGPPTHRLGTSRYLETSA